MIRVALLLCADEKALAAVTQILSELGVAFEPFPDPASGGKRLTSQRFDVILIDCDHPENATLGFENVRKSSLNQNSMTIAIVDGKEGVPNAFRLGARLVLTKPVSLEQARGTLRNALAIQRREVPDSKAASGAAAGVSSGANAQNPTVAKTEESVPATVAPKLPSRLPALTPAAPAPADWQLQKPETAASPPMARAAAAGTGAQKAGTGEMGSSVVVPPASRSPFHFKKEAASVAPPKLGRGASISPEDEDLLMCELEEDSNARRKPSASSMRARGARRKTSPSLLALLAVLLVGAGVYAAWTMKPVFRNVVLKEYGKLHLLVTGKAASPQAAAMAPKAAPKPISSPPAAAAKAVSASPKASPPTVAPPRTSVADGFQTGQDTSAQDSQGDETANKSATSSVLLPTSATRKAGSDSERVEVAAEYSDEHVSHRVAPIYPEKARHKRLEGDVLLQAAVNQDGTVDSVQVLNGDPQLVAAAVEAVRQWRYEPYYHGGRLAAFRTEVTVRFELPKKTTH